MAIAALKTREDKLEWMQRPFTWALSVCWFAAVFGLVFYLNALAPVQHICIAMIAALGVACGCVFWGVHRMSYLAGRI
jgi:hypothetical protein